jgi:hypothetical protein
MRVIYEFQAHLSAAWLLLGEVSLLKASHGIEVACEDDVALFTDEIIYSFLVGKVQ